jgi:hypothetical protein
MLSASCVQAPMADFAAASERLAGSFDGVEQVGGLQPGKGAGERVLFKQPTERKSVLGKPNRRLG